ncbi:MAG TPA: NfeD family protein [Clostridia bacterium]|nr:NfeD family protein [Clostridia bacterium]
MFAVIEAVTFGLATIWFAVGAVAAIAASAMGFNFYMQTAVFFVVSIVLLYFTRPIAKEYLKIGAQKTNVSEIIGQKGVVKKRILPHETGQVKIKGQIWTAVSEDGKEIEEKIEVIVTGVEGVKAIVKPKDTQGGN